MHVDELRPEREEHLSLTMLPLDVLHTILLQRGIGARELCALESTCLMFRQLVDEAAWQHSDALRSGLSRSISSHASASRLLIVEILISEISL